MTSRRPCRWCHEIRDICPDCERRAEDIKADRVERDAERWVRRGEQWAEDVVYGEVRP